MLVLVLVRCQGRQSQSCYLKIVELRLFLTQHKEIKTSIKQHLDLRFLWHPHNNLQQYQFNKTNILLHSSKVNSSRRSSLISSSKLHI